MSRPGSLDFSESARSDKCSSCSCEHTCGMRSHFPTREKNVGAPLNSTDPDDAEPVDGAAASVIALDIFV